VLYYHELVSFKLFPFPAAKQFYTYSLINVWKNMARVFRNCYIVGIFVSKFFSSRKLVHNPITLSSSKLVCRSGL
jgi:hypothetical protein